jgi:two-component system, NtrC family, sensor kinase
LLQLGLQSTDYEAHQSLFKSPKLPHILEMASSFASLLKSGNIIDIAVGRASKIVFALKKFSHSEATEAKTPTNLAESLETVLTIYSNQMKRGIELKCEFASIEPVMAFSDELNQVWTNLIYNALQAMDFVGHLDIRLEKINNEAIISIKDSGGGIPQDIQSKIFDTFFTTKIAGEGTGLGLSITKKIIEKHDGRIEFESIIGQGTTFKVFLPA